MRPDHANEGPAGSVRVAAILDQLHASGMVGGDDLRSLERLIEMAARRKWDADSGSGDGECVAVPRVLIDPEIADLVPGYLEARRREIADVHRALEAGEFTTIARVGHNLKGSGTGYGFTRLTELGRSLEAAARDSDAAAVELYAGAVGKYLGEVEWGT